LTEQAANGTYGTQSLKAIKSEINARLEEIDRIAANCEFSGQYMMNGSLKAGLGIQVGIDGTAAKSRIHLDKSLFANGKVAGLFTNSANLAKKCSGQVTGTGNTAQEQLAAIDTVISTISERITTLGAAQNRIESAIESIGVQSENITSSLSTLRDADVATESSNYIKAQILQQASATLLATANQSPSIALNLL
jgi:flagellin